MRKLQFIPSAKRTNLNYRICDATSAFGVIIEVLNTHNLPTTTEEVAKALKSPSYLRDQAVAEAEAYATKTKAPATVRERAVRDAVDSVSPELIKDLTDAVRKWVEPFTPTDFVQDEQGDWVISPSVTKAMKEAITVEVEGEDLAMAERLQAFCAEFKEIDRLYGFANLTKSVYNAGSAPIEEFAEFVLRVKELRAARQ